MSKPSHPIKVITCCYCGARSTLSIAPGKRLFCHGCGAPVSQIAPLQVDAERRKKKTKGPKQAIPHPAERGHEHLPKDRPARRKKGKRKKRSIWHHIGEVFDDFDDFDDILDFFD